VNGAQTRVCALVMRLSQKLRKLSAAAASSSDTDSSPRTPTGRVTPTAAAASESDSAPPPPLNRAERRLSARLLSSSAGGAAQELEELVGASPRVLAALQAPLEQRLQRECAVLIDASCRCPVTQRSHVRVLWEVEDPHEAARRGEPSLLECDDGLNYDLVCSPRRLGETILHSGLFLHDEPLTVAASKCYWALRALTELSLRLPGTLLPAALHCDALAALRTLELSDSPRLQQLPEQLSCAPNLRTLRVARCALHGALNSAPLRSLVQLHTLDLSGNALLQQLPPDFAHNVAPTLRQLDVSSCPDLEAPHLDALLPQLRELSVQHSLKLRLWIDRARAAAVRVLA